MANDNMVIELLTDSIALYESGGIDWCKGGSWWMGGRFHNAFTPIIKDLTLVEAACITGVPVLAFRMDNRDIGYDYDVDLVTPQHYPVLVSTRDELDKQAKIDDNKRYPNSIFLPMWNDTKGFANRSPEGTEYMTDFLKRTRNRVQEEMQHALLPT